MPAQSRHSETESSLLRAIAPSTRMYKFARPPSGVCQTQCNFSIAKGPKSLKVQI
ncbi:MAG: hypothetical protein JGK17_14005 [Microcoleus sp. PH2017_10_PVI_O_A]|uniref:hypothetical protein n=1 Tax=unclassified Microcoleus TaxID=2642155 RepID=UPI001D26205B|nr:MULTISPECIES: hypothetical protein [unclassified Microcoleus]MCC3406678.1 hypothetical protein [Microcoleus sp. PH2017_10_PVI_O_A]MCC3460674.1 hypothetical protein [Microcoleus sp. PH2017_11_PCY_U_A]MCC3479237.1 hypothetical protein [Microcoleus sp. PH2017_12_PCY_D_A]MCC3528176.1 hypothetical protein [Microcoleus sp. PH2017_21_RUC_O_A]MCC3540203.1 hypothetical protein [Microcoleus sp. PH2017_22_RUC_O_B]